MLIIAFEGNTFNKESQIAKEVQELQVGGVILFDWNIYRESDTSNSADSLRALCANLQGLRDEKLMICIDQEGGYVKRLKVSDGFKNTPSAQSIGEEDDPSKTTLYYRQMSELLSDLNINTNLAPCVDIIANEDCPAIAKNKRSYSTNPEEVIEHSSIFINELNKKGIISSLKHFPGHGSSTSDSHMGFTDISETWSREELIPFIELLNPDKKMTILVGHLFNKNIDSQYPASLSYASINGFLRGELGWQGVVISDDMTMGAITNNYSFEESVLLAINAGCDMLIFSNPSTNGAYTSELFIKTVINYIKQGKISIKRIEESYQRIQSLLDN